MNQFPANEPLLVGVGASAGGLEALQELLSAIADPSGIAIAFVQHLDPNSRSLLADELTTTRTDLDRSLQDMEAANEELKSSIPASE